MPSFLNSIFGSKPTVPNLPGLNLGQEQQTAIGANQAALGGAQALVGQANLFSRNQIDQMLGATGTALQGSSANAIADMIAGKVPLSDEAMLHDRSVAQSFGLGTAGSGGMGALAARDLGLTQLGLVQQGINSAQNWMKTMASIYEPSMMNVSSMFISPAQQAAFSVEERNSQFQRQWMQNQISALPDPVLSGINAEVMSLAAAYLGGSSKQSDYTQSYGGVGRGGVGGGGGGGWDTGWGNDYGGEMSGAPAGSGNMDIQGGGGMEFSGFV